MFAFSAQHVSRLTGLSDRQLRYWDQTGFFSPSFGEEDRRRPFSRVYSFRDVVGLRTIAMLRGKVPLQQLRRLGAWLAEHYETPWSSLRFRLIGKEIQFYDPKSQNWVTTRRPGQAVLREFDLSEIAQETAIEAERLKDRQPDDFGRIVRNRFVLNNAPVVAGTRIPVSAIWNFHAAGFTAPQIIEQYPRLTDADVAAAVNYVEQSERQQQAV
jgi:uncharacterized protein (DUF433 family)